MKYNPNPNIHITQKGANIMIHDQDINPTSLRAIRQKPIFALKPIFMVLQF